MSETDEKKCPEILDAQPDENGSEDHDGGKRTPHRLQSEAVGVAVAPFLVGYDKGGKAARLPLPSRSSLDEAIRGIIRDEVRAVLREELSGLLGRAAPTPLKAVTSGSDYLPTKAAAAIAGVRPETIRIWVTSHRLPAHWAGNRMRIRRDQLEAFLVDGGATEHAVDLEVRARELAQGRNVQPSGGR